MTWMLDRVKALLNQGIHSLRRRVRQHATKTDLDAASWPHRPPPAAKSTYSLKMKLSAGILLFRRRANGVEVFLVHPGGPYWEKKDLCAWTIPKGEYEEGEDPLTAARREVQEETGLLCAGDFIPLGEVKQRGGKRILAWAMEGDIDPSSLVSNICSIEWPPRSGKLIQAPEIDRGEWFLLPDARKRILGAQVAFLDALAVIVS